MGDPYWRYGAAASAAPPSSSDRGSIPQASFPGYLSTEASTLTNYNPYSSIDLRAPPLDFLQKDIVPSRGGAYRVDDIHSEPGVSGLIGGSSFRDYPSSFDDPNLLVRQRDVVSGTSSGVPDVSYGRPNSMLRTDGPPVSAGESNVLFVDGLPTDSTRREIGHLFRPFIGFRELRVVHKEPRRRGDKAMVLCFVEFTDAKCAVTAMEALQGYKFDDRKPESPLLRIHFAHFPFRLPTD
ncbi:hypothetical protein ABFS82_05G137700 [Erythranthe guttata]|uniref:RRM domain-containing protein n=1 Tax=Erythranthe guttata TaxID=4155 RepID=A0A022QP06_ERYGU|nr:PREDICTED: U1 small nuclear ribonucleoprotein A-like [Erythranthe guttata]XP_012847295.1 PREDICTED: U1 small nuclear ribonucleoprotein A-like [Erythranthe guttata]EYU29339.1 hypothetical protein MIMGU_mgv1a012896mg [Erythranthe guttata]|eukprot:XP_012847294.1 PREDICTED: U1 small nuclear ribonucleoprotein A-like [Erythranthe guttata]